MQKMDDSIFITLGIPQHGWLPVSFRHMDLDLSFYASDVLNDPLAELYKAITHLREQECRQVTWWLEPGAYIFEMVKRGPNIVLTIFETDHLHDDKAKRTMIQTINAPGSEIIQPFRIALTQFCAGQYEVRDWRYKPDMGQLPDGWAGGPPAVKQGKA